jgi:hypothetical protein
MHKPTNRALHSPDGLTRIGSINNGTCSMQRFSPAVITAMVNAAIVAECSSLQRLKMMRRMHYN